MATISPSTSSTSSNIDPRIQITFDAVNWDVLSSLACKLHQVDSSHWGEQISGGYNLVRFLHLHDSENTTLVARVPLRSEDDDLTAQKDSPTSKRIASEVATLEYIESHTDIPVPHVYHHSAHAEGDVRSPLTLHPHVQSRRCSAELRMERHGRRETPRHAAQVIDIYLELWSHRFDKNGLLFKGNDGWCIEPSSVIEDPEDISHRHGISTTSYSNAADYWLAYANAKLRDLYDEDFGSSAKQFNHAMAWFIRSLIPSLFDPSIDAHGYPLCPGGFHSQNIIITDVDIHPRITGVIDWEFSGPDFPTSFAQYPLFIVDHPAWDDDHPLRERNIRDQATFDELILKAERIRHNPVGGPRLSHLISNCYGIYLFVQLMNFPVSSSVLYPCLFAHVFGENDDFSVKYYDALMKNGILKKNNERFDREEQVWLEARGILGGDKVGQNMTLGEFKDLVSKSINRFDDGGNVREWLAS
jgi:hypothetical protein